MTNSERGGAQQNDIRPTENGESRNVLTAWRSSIINNIVKNGIQPADKLSQDGVPFVASYDDWVNNRVYANGLHPVNRYLGSMDHFLETEFDYFMYHGNRCIIPVLLERPYDQELKTMYQATSLSEAKRQMYAERAASSFLVVIDYMRTAGVRPENLTHFIFPETIWKEYKSSPHAQDISVPTRIVHGSIDRSLKPVLPGKLTVPDYESALIALSREVDKSFWVHGVRLPTMEDVQRRN